MTLTPLPLTNAKPGHGEAIIRIWPGVGPTPACSVHGAMNRVAADKDWWRCPTCNIGVEWDRT